MILFISADFAIKNIKKQLTSFLHKIKSINSQEIQIFSSYGVSFMSYNEYLNNVHFE